MRTKRPKPPARPEISRFSRKERPHMPGSPTVPDRRGARDGALRRVAYRLINGVGVRDSVISRLNGWPVCSPADASPCPRGQTRTACAAKGRSWSSIRSTPRRGYRPEPRLIHHYAQASFRLRVQVARQSADRAAITRSSSASVSGGQPRATAKTHDVSRLRRTGPRSWQGFAGFAKQVQGRRGDAMEPLRQSNSRVESQDNRTSSRPVGPSSGSIEE